MRVDILGHARITHVGKCQSCMDSQCCVGSVRSTLDAKLNVAVVLGEARRTQEAEGGGNDVIEQLLTVHKLTIGDPEVLRVRGHIIGHARNNM